MLAPELMPFYLTTAELAALDDRAYTAQVKARLRAHDNEWEQLLDPILRERTRATLRHMIRSIDKQRERVGNTDPAWDKKVRALRSWTRNRLESITEPEDVATLAVSSTKEAKAWRAFSARLARQLAKSDPAALQRLRTPYGGLTAAEWLSARESKS